MATNFHDFSSIPRASASSDVSPLPTSGPFGLAMTDDALVTFGKATAAGLAFTDIGFMPVNGITIGGPLVPPGSGLFIQYYGDGIQKTGPNGTEVDYSRLHYDLIEYSGTATFGHAADGTPTVTGITNPVLLAHGSIPTGQGVLRFTDHSISGELSASFHGVGLLAGQNGTLAITVVHPFPDLSLGANTIQLDRGTLTATFTPTSGS